MRILDRLVPRLVKRCLILKVIVLSPFSLTITFAILDTSLTHFAHNMNHGGEVMKIKDFIAVSILNAALVSVASAQGTATPAKNDVQHSQAQLNKLVREAHSQEDYQALANYYGKQQEDFLQQAAQEKTEWERRGQNVMGVLAKYPRPVDSAKYLYESYAYRATEAGSLSAKYSQLAQAALTAPAHK